MTVAESDTPPPGRDGPSIDGILIAIVITILVYAFAVCVVIPVMVL